jgi:hypothetical protein
MGQKSLRWLVGRSIDGSVWRPSHGRYLRDQVLNLRRNELAGYSDRDHIIAAARWLARAQDASNDGGVSGRYSVRSGWTSSYPETTGYIIPTFLSLSRIFGSEYHDRARHCVEFLKPLQLPDGAFPAGELHENRARPSVFNSAQILHGLVSWHAATGDADAAEAASRTANWLNSRLDADGAWRKDIYNGLVTTYTAHASCWLAEAGLHFGVEEWTSAAERHLDWVLSHVDNSTGWIDLTGFSEEDHRKRRSVTHTLAYTLWGILDLSESLDRPDGVAVARRAAEHVARRLELSGSLAGELDSKWKASRSDYSCLTGNAQMALIWFRLARMNCDARFINAGIKALDLVKAAQPMDSGDPGIRGGIPGSSPAWGEYIYMALPNWAAKFFIDAMLAKQDALASLEIHPPGLWVPPDDIPRALPTARRRTAPAPRVVMLSTPDSHKVPQMMGAWSAWGFRPSAVVLEHREEPGFLTRLARRMRSDGVTRTIRNALLQRLRRASGAGSESTAITDVAAFCEANGIPILRVGSLSHPDAVASVKSLEPDVLVHAGAGILRSELLATARLGTLNAHMGILPRYRGMNVSEWACLEGNPVGCTVHLVNAGIDTGDIVAIREVATASAHTIEELRNLVDEAQIALLGEVLHFVVDTGCLPATRPQTADEGRQYFRMHPDLKSVLESKLARQRVKDRVPEARRNFQPTAALTV